MKYLRDKESEFFLRYKTKTAKLFFLIIYFVVHMFSFKILWYLMYFTKKVDRAESFISKIWAGIVLNPLAIYLPLLG